MSALQTLIQDHFLLRRSVETQFSGDYDRNTGCLRRFPGRGRYSKIRHKELPAAHIRLATKLVNIHCLCLVPGARSATKGMEPEVKSSLLHAAAGLAGLGLRIVIFPPPQLTEAIIYQRYCGV